MKLFAVPLAFAFAFPALAWASLIPPSFPTRVRVRLAEASPRAVVRGFDLRFFESVDAGGRGNPGANRKLAATPDRASEWELRCQEGRIRAVPTAGTQGGTLDLKEPVRIMSPAGFVRLDGRPYREDLEVRSVGSLCEIVNHVELEKYLDGLVNSEFNSRWSEEAIGAQVVAARTYALHQILLARAEARHYDLDSTTRDQVYDGTHREDPRSSRAVERTRGWVLTVGPQAKPAPLKAFYHSTCGGMTELPEHVWGAPFAGFKRAVRCPYCHVSPAYRWKLELGARDVARAFELAAASGDENAGFARNWPRGWRSAVRGGELEDVRAGSANAEGRIATVATVWRVPSARGSVERMTLEISGAKFREWLGPARFRSASFQVHRIQPGKPPAPRWLFQGRGNGHGVGMCQWGAKAMGERGFKTAAILRHYYPDAVLRKLW